MESLFVLYYRMRIDEIDVDGISEKAETGADIVWVSDFLIFP